MSSDYFKYEFQKETKVKKQKANKNNFENKF